MNLPSSMIRSMSPWPEDYTSLMESFRAMAADFFDTRLSPVPCPFDEDSLEQRLQGVVEGSRGSWTYAIFWQLSVHVASGASLLCFRDGYDEDDVDGKRKEIAAASAVEQEHRKRMLREVFLLRRSVLEAQGEDLQELVEELEEGVTDTEWFILVSATRLFVDGSGLPGKAQLTGEPTWIAAGLDAAPCERARQAYAHGIRTMVCVPVGTAGVLELGSTEAIPQTAKSVAEILSLFASSGGGSLATDTKESANPIKARL